MCVQVLYFLYLVFYSATQVNWTLFKKTMLGLLFIQTATQTFSQIFFLTSTSNTRVVQAIENNNLSRSQQIMFDNCAAGFRTMQACNEVVTCLTSVVLALKY